MTILWGVLTTVLALCAVVVMVLLGRPLYLVAEIWWVLFLAFLAGMVAAWHGQNRRNRRPNRPDGETG